YLPLDPNYPRERLAFMLADANAPVLVTQQAMLEKLPELATSDRHVVRLDADWPLIARKPATAPATALDPRHPAYVIYTSGSTGTPKGVVVEHASIANKAVTLGRQFAIGADHRVALLSSCAFDPSIEQITMPLVCGATIAIVDDITRETPQL